LILTQFGKLSLKPDNGNATQTNGGSSPGFVGITTSSGEAVAPSDNTGLTPTFAVKSGGTLSLAGKPGDEKGKVKSWLDSVIQKYLAKRGKTDLRGRALASPTKMSGLPDGTLLPKEPLEANFVPEGLAIREGSLAGDSSEGMDPKKRLLIISGLAVLSLRALWFLRRRSQARGREEAAALKRRVG